jgi:hypothetical protein
MVKAVDVTTGIDQNFHGGSISLGRSVHEGGLAPLAEGSEERDA